MKKDHILVPEPNSKFLKIECKECGEKQVVFSHASINFDNIFRIWGLDGGFSQSARGVCDSSRTCQIWDWSLQTSSEILNNSLDGQNSNPAFLPDPVACPPAVDGNNFIVDQQTTSNMYLVNATEIIGDNVGNDNGLCESNEACIYSPNFGAYQGDVNSLSTDTCAFADGPISGVKMYGYTSNGNVAPPPTHTIFVSSVPYDGNLGGLTGADSVCQARASVASLPGAGTYKAVMSNSSIPANSRIFITMEVRNTNGMTVATDSSQFWSGSIQNPVDYDEMGTQIISVLDVWTNTDSSGSIVDTIAINGSCDNWTSNQFIHGGFLGRADMTDSEWLKKLAGAQNCNQAFRIYCISQ